MKIGVTQMGSVTVMSPHGAIAQDDTDEFQHALEEQRQQSLGRIVLDFGDVAFLDSRAVEALWDFADHQHEAGRSAKMASVQELCREILELTGVSPNLDIYDSTESAVRSFV